MANRIVLVFCYKCSLTPKYKRYLRDVARYVNANKAFVKAVIVSGGFSQLKSFPGMTESTVAVNFLRPKISADIPILQELTALTTRGNVENSKALIKEFFNGNKFSVVIFCDAIRALKTKLVAEKFFKDYPFEMMTYDISRPGETKKQLLAAFAELAALYFPPLDYVRNKFVSLKAKRL